MANHALADLVVVVHFGYASFLLFGLIAIFIGRWRNWRWVKNRWFRAIHLLMIAIVVAETWAGITCPLTTLENRLRSSEPGRGYEGDFIARWAHDLLFIDAPPWAFNVMYSVFGILVLLSLFIVRPNWTSKTNAARLYESS